MIPGTAVLGAILLTVYFGGAAASQVRIGEPMFAIAVIFGVLCGWGSFCAITGCVRLSLCADGRSNT